MSIDRKETKCQLLLKRSDERENPSPINVARCYSLVFRDEPWNEAFVDSSGKFYGPEFDLTFRQKGLERAYPLEATSEYIESEISRPASVFLTLSQGRRVFAFGWGYAISSVEELISEKWKGVGKSDFQKIQEVISFSSTTQELWYLSEVGVLREYREKGIATSIVDELISRAPSDKDILMRTNAGSPMTVIARKFGFKQIIGPKTEKTDEDIVVSNTEVVNFLDLLNPERVLYVLPAEVRLR